MTTEQRVSGGGESVQPAAQTVIPSDFGVISQVEGPSLRTSQAAQILGVRPSTLRSWEHRFKDFNPAVRTGGGQRLYWEDIIQRLGGLRASGLSISEAMAAMKEAEAVEETHLPYILENFNRIEADKVVENMIGVKTVETIVAKNLMPALRTVAERRNTNSAHWDFAAKWGQGWLHRLDALATPPTRESNIWLGNTVGETRDPQSLEISAFSLLTRRSGFDVLELSTWRPKGLTSAAEAGHPGRVVLAGSDATTEELHEWSNVVSKITGQTISHTYLNPDITDVVDISKVIALSDLPEQAAKELTDGIFATL